MTLHYIGLGKMGHNMVLRLLEKGYNVHAYDPSEEARARAHEAGAVVFGTLQALLTDNDTPTTIWLMVPHQAVDAVLAEIFPLIKKDDTVIDGGNSPYKETIRRAPVLAELGAHFLDAGISGGPAGARNGACVMVGGTRQAFDVHEQLFKDIALPNGYLFVGTHGAGHFVKMVHNGIEYGMMQAIAEGFALLKKSDFELPLQEVAELYNTGSVIESRLIGWLVSGFQKHTEELNGISGSASASGEGLWTVEAGRELGVPTPVIEDAVRAREESQKSPNYQGKIISVLRNEFGGHAVAK